MNGGMNGPLEYERNMIVPPRGRESEKVVQELKKYKHQTEMW